MKKFLFLLSFLTLGALTTMNAQTEGKACSKKSTKCCAKKANAATMSTAKTTSVAAASATAEGKSCAKKCAKTCTKTTSAEGKTTAVAGVIMTASEAAAADESVEERVCSDSGKVSYYQKATCPMSGKVSVSQVRYDMESAKFVNLSPKEMKSCNKANATSCKKEVKSAKVVKTSVKE